MDAVITFTTDFGLADAYVAAMKGVVLGINPAVRLVDICHSIKPRNVSQAAFILSTACEFSPRRTVHLEISLKDGDAGAYLDAGVGDEVTIRGVR